MNFTKLESSSHFNVEQGYRTEDVREFQASSHPSDEAMMRDLEAK